jgi:hypothetical protein
MTAAESYDAAATRLSSQFPQLTSGRILGIMSEEHDLLLGFDPADVIAPIVIEATLERIQMELERLARDSDGIAS